MKIRGSTALAQLMAFALCAGCWLSTASQAADLRAPAATRHPQTSTPSPPSTSPKTDTSEAPAAGQPDSSSPPPNTTTHDLTAADLSAWLSGLVPYGLTSGDIAGAVIVVVKDGQVLFQSGYGYADVDKKIPMDANRTLTRIGSTSKLFT